MSIIVAAAAQIANHCQHRIDDQRTASVMRADIEPNLKPVPEDVLPGHFAPAAPETLVDHRPAVRYPSGAGLQSQIAFPVDFDIPSAAKGQPDGTPGCARRHYQIVFQPVLVSIVDEVNAGIEIPIFDALVERHSGAPLFRTCAHKVVGSPGLWSDCLRLHAWARAHEPEHGLRLMSARARSLDDGAGRGERHWMPGNIRDEGLPAGFRPAPFKCQRHLAVSRRVDSRAIPRKKGVG
jgi:hypothetical protein